MFSENRQNMTKVEQESQNCHLNTYTCKALDIFSQCTKIEKTLLSDCPNFMAYSTLCVIF